MTESLEQFAARIAQDMKRTFQSNLDDDVIARLTESHVIFGKACIIAAVKDIRPTFPGNHNERKSA